MVALSKLATHQSRPVQWPLAVALVKVHPTHVDERLANALSDWHLFVDSDVPQTLDLLAASCSHQLWVERGPCDLVIVPPILRYRVIEAARICLVDVVADFHLIQVESPARLQLIHQT